MTSALPVRRRYPVLVECRSRNEVVCDVDDVEGRNDDEFHHKIPLLCILPYLPPSNKTVHNINEKQDGRI